MTPAPGHLFPVGTTTVSGNARDVVLLDPDPDPDPVMQAATVGAGATTPVSFDVEVIPTIPTPIPADIYLVLDDTGSMNGVTPAGPGGETPAKIDALKDNMATLMDVLAAHRTGVGDNIGAFTFKVPPGQPSGGCDPAWLQPLVPLGSLDDRVQNDPTEPNDINIAVAGMPADGDATPIRIALQESSDQLSVQPTDRKRWIVLLTDGKQNTDDCLIGSVREPEFNDPQVVKFRTDFLADRQINLLAVGFGSGNAINGPLLRTLAGGPDDYFDFASEGRGSLTKWFNAAVSRVLDQAEVVDPHGVLTTGESVTESVPLTRACRSATFILTWTDDDLKEPPRLCVESPGAEPIRISELDHDPSRGVTWVKGRFHRILVLRFPLADEWAPFHRGEWKATVTGPGSSRGTESTSYTLAVLADEPVRTRCSLPRRKITAGEEIPLRVIVEGGPIRTATVTAEVIGLQQHIGAGLAALDLKENELFDPDGRSERHAGLMEWRMDRLAESRANRREKTSHTVTLEAAPRNKKSRGHEFIGKTRPLKIDGAYSVVFRVEGQTLLGDRFRRECSMGFFAAPNIEASDEIHAHLADGKGLVFDWTFRPSSRTMIANLLGPGHADDFVVDVHGGSSGPIVDQGDGTYDVRITRDSLDRPADVTVKFNGSRFTAFELPLPPAVRSITPSDGPERGGNRVRIHGENFTQDMKIVFGDNALEKFEFVSTTLLHADAPAGAGTVLVNVVRGGGAGPKHPVPYTYVPKKDEIDPCSGEAKHDPDPPDDREVSRPPASIG